MAATSTSLALPSEFVSERRKFTYVAAGSSDTAMLPSLAACWAHWSMTFPFASFTSIEKRCCGSEQSSASLTNATTTLAPSRTNPVVASLNARRMAWNACGCRAPAEPAWTSCASQLLKVAASLAERGRIVPGLPGANRSCPASSKVRTQAAALQT